MISVGAAGLGYWGPNLVRNLNASSQTELAWLCDSAPDRLETVYDRGVDVSTDPSGIRDVLISYRSGDVVSPKLDATEPLFRLVEHFADCIERRIAPISGGEQGLRIVRVLAAAQESLSRGSERVMVLNPCGT